MASELRLGSADFQARWVGEMSGTLALCADLHPSECVYTVPESITQTRPEAYGPQRMGLGAYHHLRPHLHKMQKRKLGAVRQAQSPDNLHAINQIVESIFASNVEPIVRGCYDQFLDLDANTLAWIVTVDGLFLLEYLKSTLEMAIETDHSQPEMEHLVGDILMLENQIPTVLLKIIGLFYRRCLVQDDTDEVHKACVDFLLNGSFLAFCQKHSPLKLSNEWAVVRDTDQSHLLHRMYHLIVNNRGSDHKLIMCDAPVSDSELNKDPASNSPEITDVHPPCSVEDVHRNPNDVASTLDQVFPASQLPHSSVIVIGEQGKMPKDDTLAHMLHHMNRLVDITIANNKNAKASNDHDDDGNDNCHGPFRPQTYSLSIVEPVLVNAQKLSSLLIDLGVPFAGTVHNFLSIIGQVPWDGISTMWGQRKAECPPVEQIEMPTATDMSQLLGITFLEASGGIRDVKFDEGEKTLHLPAITMNAHAETILRNLLAYEAATMKTNLEARSLKLAEYVDMICGMVDTKNDISILRTARIVRGEMADEEVARIFNGIAKTGGEGRDESNIGKAIRDINKMYSKNWRVKVKRKLEKVQGCMGKGLKYANAIVVVLVVALLSMQAFCLVFGCSRPRLGQDTAHFVSGFLRSSD